MPLVTQKKESLSGGVNQQAAEHRLNSQVEEMINCVPTIDSELIKRPSTTAHDMVDIFGNITTQFVYSKFMWTYEYDKGSMSGDRMELAYSITSAGLQILDVNRNMLYTEGAGVNYVQYDPDNTDPNAPTTFNYIRTFTGVNGYAATTVKDTVFLVNKAIVPNMQTATGDDFYKREGYVWIKRVDVIAGYTYGVAITYKNLADDTETIVDVVTGAIALGSQEAAHALATAVNDHADTIITAGNSGSVVQILAQTGYEILSVSSYDSFGDTASFGWAHKVDSLQMLPNNVGVYTPLVRVGVNDSTAYWLAYTEGAWIESIDTADVATINNTTMPHIIERKIGDSGKLEFFLSPYVWDDKLVGDSESNPTPSYLDEENPKPLKDICFFRNRMVIVTSDSISLSEIGEYGNFFRTSVAAVLDSDRIDAGVESRSSIRIEYALVYDDGILLFSDKAQFKFEGGDVLSPSSYKISEITTYEMDISVRPITVNDKTFFIARRGNHSAIYQMVVADNVRSSVALDVSAHIQTYIDSNSSRLTASPVNEMLFLTSANSYGNVFVYKFYDVGNTRNQSAWSTWNFNGDIYCGFVLRDKFHMYIKREDAFTAAPWTVGSGQWLMDKPWRFGRKYPWIMSPDTLAANDQYENMPIVLRDQTGLFLDGSREDRDFAGAPVRSFVNFGEWVYGAEGNKSSRGTLQMKTIQVESEGDLPFSLWIQDLNRNTSRVIDWKYHKGRRPVVGGQAKYMRTGIVSDTASGFRISSVSFEGNLNRRAAAH